MHQQMQREALDRLLAAIDRADPDALSREDDPQPRSASELGRATYYLGDIRACANTLRRTMAVPS